MSIFAKSDDTPLIFADRPPCRLQRCRPAHTGTQPYLLATCASSSVFLAGQSSTLHINYSAPHPRDATSSISLISTHLQPAELISQRVYTSGTQNVFKPLD
ncbi:hypothetical protein FRC12_006243 [Ceratobasidium sp. 428]|nr:hypothetical protein FRC12_006243 [Ceratobasidium sp. 428]